MGGWAPAAARHRERARGAGSAQAGLRGLPCADAAALVLFPPRVADPTPDCLSLKPGVTEGT